LNSKYPVEETIAMPPWDEKVVFLTYSAADPVGIILVKLDEVGRWIRCDSHIDQPIWP
jgi:hypothetical protein